MERIDVSKMEVKKMGLREKSRKCKSGGKPINASVTGGFSKPRTQPGLAVALALVFFAFAALLIVPFAKAADPGHPASAISGSTFDTGDFIFPTNLTVNKFFIANGTTLYVDALNGRVGIGTASPSTILNVKGTLGTALSGTVNTSTGSTLVNTSADLITEISVGDAIKITNVTNSEIFTVSAITASNITLDSAASYNWTNVNAYKDSSLFRIDNGNGTGKLIVDKSGNVGIGTTAPGATLDVAGNLMLSGSGGKKILPSSTDGADTNYLSVSGGGNNAAARGAYIHLSGNEDPSTPGKLYLAAGNVATGDIVFRTGADNAKMTILTGGNVGIGTAAPANKLEVAGDINASSGSLIFYNEIMPDGASCSNGQILKKTGSNDWDCADDSGLTSSYNSTYHATSLDVTANRTAWANQTATDVACSDCVGASDVDSTSLATECSTITGSSDLCDDDDTCSSEACTVGSDDTLTSPTVGGALDMANNAISNIGSANTDFTSDGGLTLNGNFSVLGTGTHTIAGNASFDGGTLFVDSNNDRVGIGTTSPTTKLEVSAASPDIRASATGTNWASHSISNGAGVAYLVTDNAAGTAFGTGIAYPLVLYTGYAGDIVLMPNGVDRMHINATTGNVGIGTASPTQKLDVAGTLNVSNITLKANCANGEILKWSDGVGTCGTDSSGGAGWATSGGYVYNDTATGVGIGTTGPDPWAKLDVSGTAQIRNASLSVTSGSVFVDDGTTNRYTNPGFETGSTSPWSFDAKTDGALAIYTSDVRSGAYSANITSSTVAAIALWENQEVTSGHTYTMSVYAKNISCVTTPYFSSAGVSVTTVAGGGSFTGISTSEWKRFYWVFTPTSSGTLSAYIRTNNNAVQGSFLVDDVQFEEKPMATPYVDGTRNTGDVVLSGSLQSFGAGNSTFKGNVGIGTTSPASLLHLAGDNISIRLNSTAPNVAGNIFVGSSGGINRMTMGTFTESDFAFQANSSTKMTIKADGNVGIGTTNPSAAKLVVAGNISVGDTIKSSTGDVVVQLG
jgi:hypothetical protein